MQQLKTKLILPAIFWNSSARFHIFIWQRIENHDNLTHAWDYRSITTPRWFEPNLAASKLPVSLSAITPTSHFLLLFFTFSEATQRKRGKHFHFRYTAEQMQTGQHASEHTCFNSKYRDCKERDGLLTSYRYISILCKPHMDL